MLSRGRQLRYLVAVAEHGNLTAAARRLKVAQPALSQAIGQLETELGVTLLERHSRGASLTPAGVSFLLKARVAAEAEAEAEQTAKTLARAAQGGLTVGFVGPPPAVARPELFALAAKDGRAQPFFRELPFPHGSTAAWLAGVDVAIAHAPALEEGIEVERLRHEPRTVLAQRAHPLAGLRELRADEALDACFVSYHPSVQPQWAAFHSLDDVRGGPATHMTEDHVLTPLEMLGLVSGGAGITTAPLLDARLAAQTVPQVAAIPLRDAEPLAVSLIWRHDNPNPLIEAFVDAARSLAGRGGV